MIIHATRKLAARLPKVTKEPIQEVSAVGNWHADRLTLDRRQCVNFCHDETRAALFIAGLRKPQFAALGGEIFRQLFADTLVALECPQAQIQRALLSLGPAFLAAGSAAGAGGKYIGDCWIVAEFGSCIATYVGC